ncbi:unnamed protein product, partial [Tetraodon nigroviridis]
HLQQYNYQNDDSPPHEPGFLRLTSEVTPELVHVSEKNLSEIENVHGYVSHAHISPLKSADKEHSVQMDSSLSHLRCDCRPEHVISPVAMFASIWYAKKLGRRLVQSSRKAKLLKDEVSLKECILYRCAGLG